MEEDIKILERLVEERELVGIYKTDEIVLQAIEHLIKAYKELKEKYNNELDENLKMSEWLVEKQHRIEELEENKELNFYKEWYEVYKKEISKRNIKARQVLAKLKRIKEADIVNLHEINILDEIEKELLRKE